jgi:hypothetical protein
MSLSRACGTKELMASDTSLYDDASRPGSLLHAVQDDEQMEERLAERGLDDMDDSWGYDWTTEDDEHMSMQESHFIDCNIDCDIENDARYEHYDFLGERF